MADTESTTAADRLRAQSQAHSAHNYHPLPVVISHAEGSWVTDVEGRRYLDLLAAYSALNFGHRHPRLVAAAQRQLERVTLVSRAFEHDQFGPFCAELAALAGMEMVLPMNTGAEAVETAIKTARKWGYEVKGVPDGEAVIVVFDGNFHGRTTTIISFSTDPDARASFGPYTPGFRIVPYGDLVALEAAMDANVVGVLVEPIQGEAGVLVPPAGFLAGVRDICTAHGASAAASCPSPPSCPRPTSSGCSSRASTAPPSAGTRWRARSAARSSPCSAPANFRSAPPSWARTCMTG
jgi:ornithine--oxo-acid transaminase